MKRNSNNLRVLYAKSVFDNNERRAVTEVLKTPYIGAGKKVAEFEQKIAGKFGKKYGLMVNSGSSANLIAVELLNLPPGSEVITPALTFSTTLAPLLQKGLVPVLVDVMPGFYTANIDQIEKAITPKTKALMIPSLFGNIPDLPRLWRIARKNKLYLIEDSCDTLGATIYGKPTGLYSDISTTSFYASHIITAGGEGGMVSVNRRDWAKRARILAGWGRRSSLNETEDINKRYTIKLSGIKYDSKFIFEEVGYNFRTTDIAAVFGLAQLKKLNKFSGLRQRNFRELLNFFRKYEKFFILPEQLKGVRTNWLAFPLTIRMEAPFSREQIVKHLEYANIQTRPVFTGNVLKQPGFKHMRRREMAGGYPAADFIMKNSFVVGAHHGMNQGQIDYLKTVFSVFLSRYIK